MRHGKYWDQPPFPFVPGYDVVGVVAAAGDGVDTSMVGRRYAAVTKTGGWASAMMLAAGDLVAVPDGPESAEAETVVVNGVTAWQLLHRQARARRGQAILVLGANGGVGSTLIQLARHAGIRVIGAASQRHLDAVFDNIGGPGLAGSFRLLAPGGTLLADGALTAHIAARLPLSDAAAALQLAESRTVFGKVVLVPDPAGNS